MAEIKFKSTDLGKFEKSYNEIIQSYKLELKTGQILNFLAEAILGKISDLEMSTLFTKDLELDFATACDLAYDLKIQILDKKQELDSVKAKLLGQVWQKYSPDSIVDEFLGKLNYQITDPNLKKRFVELILSWLQDVRDIPELKEALIRSVKIGGIGMPEEVFSRLYDLLIAKKEEIKNEKIDLGKILTEYESEQNKEVREMPKMAGEVEIDVAAQPAKPMTVREKITGSDTTIDQLLKDKGLAFTELNEKEEIKRQLTGERQIPEFQPSELVDKIIEEEEFLNSKEEIALPVTRKAEKREFVQPSPAIQPISKQSTAASRVQTEIKQPVFKQVMSQARPKVEDVKFETKLYGPIEELGAFKIEDFRRLAKDPAEAANKILAKLDLLEDESLAKKAEGVNALKASPLYKDYAEIMNQAIMAGKSIEQVLVENPRMSAAEFKAIMNLNKSLKY
ncbi:MAG: hypothetical protein NTX00_01660 [Candidatus Parcubacteria bacterium]|nr:hypothetical protein [Candidatus Parcubacteria bacterium]